MARPGPSMSPRFHAPRALAVSSRASARAKREKDSRAGSRNGPGALLPWPAGRVGFVSIQLGRGDPYVLRRPLPAFMVFPVGSPLVRRVLGEFVPDAYPPPARPRPRARRGRRGVRAPAAGDPGPLPRGLVGVRPGVLLPPRGHR